MHLRGGSSSTRRGIHLMTVFLGGILIPLGGLFLYLQHYGILAGFYEWFWKFNLHFRPVQVPWGFLGESILENPFLYGSALMGWMSRRHPVSLKWACLSTLGGLALSPHVYRQNYLYVGPLLSFFATAFWFGVYRTSFQRRSIWTKCAIGAVLVLCLVPPFRTQIFVLHNTNDAQLARMRCLLAITQPTDKILDFRTGESFWRPHAYYFWWLPEEHLQMLSSAIVEEGVLASLQAPDCRGIIADQSYFAAHPHVLAYVRRHYDDSGCGTLYLRHPLSSP